MISNDFNKLLLFSSKFHTFTFVFHLLLPTLKNTISSAPFEEKLTQSKFFTAAKKKKANKQKCGMSSNCENFFYLYENLGFSFNLGT